MLEGSGAALPPVAADRTVLVHPATSGPAGAGFDLYRLLLADLVVLTMCDPPFDAAAGVVDDTAMIRTVLRPVPAEPIAGARIAYFSTAPDPAGPARELAAEHGADVVIVSGNLARRDQLAGDLERAAAAGADTYLVEIKAAAIDVVAEAAAAAACGSSSAPTGRWRCPASPIWTPACSTWPARRWLPVRDLRFWRRNRSAGRRGGRTRASAAAARGFRTPRGGWRRR